MYHHDPRDSIALTNITKKKSRRIPRWIKLVARLSGERYNKRLLSLTTKRKRPFHRILKIETASNLDRNRTRKITILSLLIVREAKPALIQFGGAAD